MLPYWFSAVKKKQWGRGVLLIIIYHNACMLSHVQIFATLWTVAYQAPLSMGLQARILEWVAMPSFRDLPSPWEWLSNFQGYRALRLRSRKQASAFTRSGFSLLSKDSCVIEGAAAARETHDSFCQAQIGSESGVFSTWGMATCPASWLITPPSGLPAAGCWTLG